MTLTVFCMRCLPCNFGAFSTWLGCDMLVAMPAGLDFMWRVVLDHPNQALLLHTDQRSPADLLVEICIMHRPTQADRQAFVR